MNILKVNRHQCQIYLIFFKFSKIPLTFFILFVKILLYIVKSFTNFLEFFKIFEVLLKNFNPFTPVDSK